MSSSRRWLERQKKDRYVQKAKLDGYRSRAAYKLIEIQKKHAICHPGMSILELGSAPGSWTQLLAKWQEKKGQIYAVDLLEMSPIEGVEFIQEDIESDKFLQWCESVSGRGFNMILSDMAPNMCGHQRTDQLRSERLIETVYDISKKYLKKGGHFLVKAFHGEGFNILLKELRLTFKQVKVIKPDASRQASGEVYILGIQKLEKSDYDGENPKQVR